MASRGPLVGHRELQEQEELCLRPPFRSVALQQLVGFPNSNLLVWHRLPKQQATSKLSSTWLLQRGTKCSRPSKSPPVILHRRRWVWGPLPHPKRARRPWTKISWALGSPRRAQPKLREFPSNRQRWRRFQGRSTSLLRCSLLVAEEFSVLPEGRSLTTQRRTISQSRFWKIRKLRSWQQLAICLDNLSLVSGRSLMLQKQARHCMQLAQHWLRLSAVQQVHFWHFCLSLIAGSKRMTGLSDRHMTVKKFMPMTLAMDAHAWA